MAKKRRRRRRKPAPVADQYGGDSATAMKTDQLFDGRWFQADGTEIEVPQALNGSLDYGDMPFEEWQRRFAGSDPENIDVVDV